MDYGVARTNMIENQIRTNRVTDPLVIEAMAAVPREIFVPKAFRGVAYVDEDLAIGGGRFLLEPLNTARLLQVAAIKTSDVVLDIGCASGYSSAVLARMASTVVALECDGELAAKAMANLAELGLDNAVVVSGPLRDGYAKQAPYDVIVINGAIPAVPAALKHQLADGGRLVAVVHEKGSGRVSVTERHGDVFGHRIAFDGNSPLLKDFEETPAFVF
ncbi:protein-L-isoaspartate O-methyltransferase family protein [Rhodospirillum rubrum]|uniref:Protein-L-isoaspartate O-methyltransferase n=1 Tax=Rhodospirillum rubrum (strain ATCC 11170 / ATH 1.1.1 / DSM 467 / LMG 4362 / NCIMB 8255 / S1) TaxID=269796 RepID=Q2RTE6_RHORT|nr:protein-L-isoaspartate O-methyltransferase [Rhodospirillum rubrum]ABC22599.1 Protein-L-isoaspartate(D-aspartate) O-methyltransferase [Rhodospirillum rubrum ATCC 11170]AEO48317.1 protein-L-isoaspartate(D-aspartate) O-methyltransferase [Rhodospirillum rubrum F11]MBK5954187.1 protein-L-isoaspartate O-methyltransferase [Rhodospirillum rubrum]QXG82223.1 protein-L-isoaspartate O-methyltransferase [Rhodospirillum rubrum]HAQ00816.1 protein-L-isoaspartate O-methyltransferase [Rhodospirillum rubrum]